MGDVLDRVIPPLLILGATICRPKVERVICGAVILDAEGDTHIATRGFAGIWCLRAGDLSLDHAVGEFESLDRSQLWEQQLFVGGHTLEPPPRLFGRRDPQPLFALQHGWLGDYIVQPEAGRRVQWVSLR